MDQNQNSKLLEGQIEVSLGINSIIIPRTKHEEYVKLVEVDGLFVFM